MRRTDIGAALEAHVRSGDLPGAAALAYKGGIAEVVCVGWRDRDAGLPMARDTLFRIASMTKPITSVAALILHEAGRFELDEPIVGWAPEFADMRVLGSPDGPLEDTVAADRPITFRDLLTHRAGLTYAGFHAGPIGAAYDATLGGDIDSPVPPEAWVAGLASLPLIDQPGRGFHYGRATDLLGLLLGRMEQASLGEVLRQRIFEPLGMTETSFVAPPEKRARRCAAYGFDAEGRSIQLAAPPGGAVLPERPADMAYESGGAGLWSTLDDYLAFARLFVEGGRSGGVRLLRPETLALMTTNQLTPTERAEATMLGQAVFAQGHGFGLGVAVVMEPEHASVLRCGGGEGSVGWPGAYGGWWQADPHDGSVLIFLTHNMADLSQFARGIGLGAYMAITEFQALATGG